MTREHIQIAIIGGGPGGLAAALYAARGRANTVVFERGIPGGQIITTDWVENYPGFPGGINGAELGDLMTKQAEEHGAIIRTFSPIESISKLDSGHFLLDCEDEQFEADVVIVATGAVPRKLGIPGEAEFTGRGVSWCATCDGALYKEKTVAVIGGGDAAVEEAMFLTKFAAKVHLIHRRDEFRATKCIRERCQVNPKIEEHLSRVPVEIVGGDGKVAGVRLESTKGEPEEYLALDGVFIFVGVHPVNELVQGLVDLSPAGYVRIDHDGRTNVSGLFAAGDVTDSELKQVITAASKGASAAFEALRYLDENTECSL
ncbi:MAG: thioredoxin-disulfide reductase [Coriobacteriia bacterium]|nr:thioredoxin-disulfide reductase [Coriobacteriia bacterium]